MAATLTTLDKLLKDLYLPRLTGQFYKQTPVLSRVKRRAEGVEFVGRKALIALVAGRNEAVGARAEAATLPTAGNMEVSNAEVAMKYVYGSVKITGQTIAASKRSEGAFSRALTLEMEGIKESMMYDLGRQVSYGDGTGVLAMANGAGSSATSLIVDNPGVNFLRKNMVIDVYTATSGGSQELNSITITAVNTSTNTCTVASSTWSDNSYVFREDARGQEVMGLGGIVD